MARRLPQPPRKSNAPVLLGLFVFTGTMFAVPLFLQKRHQRLQNGGSLFASEEPLNAQAIRRGTYVNAGSRDVGPDRDWDHKNFLYKGAPPAVMDADNTVWIRSSSSSSA